MLFWQAFHIKETPSVVSNVIMSSVSKLNEIINKLEIEHDVRATLRAHLEELQQAKTPTASIIEIRQSTEFLNEVKTLAMDRVAKINELETTKVELETTKAQLDDTINELNATQNALYQSRI